MNSTEYSAIYNYVVRGEYPAGFSKEEKRSLRVKVEARGTQKELGRKFLAKDGLLFYVDKRPDGLGIRERRTPNGREDGRSMDRPVFDTFSCWQGKVPTVERRVWPASERNSEQLPT